MSFHRQQQQQQRATCFYAAVSTNAAAVAAAPSSVYSCMLQCTECRQQLFAAVLTRTAAPVQLACLSVWLAADSTVTPQRSILCADPAALCSALRNTVAVQPGGRARSRWPRSMWYGLMLPLQQQCDCRCSLQRAAALVHSAARLCSRSATCAGSILPCSCIIMLMLECSSGLQPDLDITFGCGAAAAAEAW